MITKLNFQGFPFNVTPPSGWLISSLDGIVDNIQSGFASGKHNKSGEGIPHLRPMNINPDGEIDLTDIRYIDPNINTLRLSQGDILFNNTNSQIWVGKTAQIKIGDELAFSNHMTRVKVNLLLVNAEFIAKLFNFLRTFGYFQIHCKKHVNQASIAGEFLRNQVPLFVPPTNEQRRIVVRIEEFQTRSRRAREALESIPDLLDQLRQSILSAAFRGDLTKEWRESHPDIEPATELLKRIRSERRKCWEEAELEKLKSKGLSDDKLQEAFANRRKQYKEPAPVDTTDLPQIPEGWCWASIEELSQWVTDGTHQPPPFTDNGIPFLVISNMVRGYIAWDSVQKWVSTETYDKYTGFYKPALGDIIYSTVGSYGVAVEVMTNMKFMFQRHIAHIRPISEHISVSYLSFALNSPSCKKQADKASRGVAQKTVNLFDLRRFAIPLSPLSEQYKLNELLYKSLKILSNNMEQSNSLESMLQIFEQSILSKAFRGELVPQDPNDEPASTLLERIRQGKARTVAAPKAKDKRNRGAHA